MPWGEAGCRACGRRRQAAEVKKQGALRCAESTQGDYVFKVNRYKEKSAKLG